MKRLAAYLIILITVALSSSLKAQIDKVHYIPPLFAPENNFGDVRDHYLILSTPSTTPFDVYIKTSNKIIDTVSISKALPFRYHLGSKYDATGIVGDDSLNINLKEQGLILSASKDFFANLTHKTSLQGGILTSKGTSALGRSFYSGHIFSVPYSNPSSDRRKSHFISFMARDNNTTVTVSNSKVRFQGHSNNSFSVKLNAGESYVLGAVFDFMRANDFDPNDYNGTKIVSNRPIAVNTGSWCGSGNPANQQDIGFDQIVPVYYTGNQYAVVKGRGTDLNEKVIIVSTSNTNPIWVNGNYLTTLNAGQYYIIEPSYYSEWENMYIRSEKSIYTYQTLSGAYSDPTVGFVFLPPLSCLSNNNVIIAFADEIGNPVLNLTTIKGSEITINSKPIITLPDSIPGNNDWVSYRIRNVNYYSPSRDTFFINSSMSINAELAVESGAIGAAGFYSGFGASPQINDYPVINEVQPCYPDNILLVASGYNDFLWYRDGELIIEADNDSIIPDNTGTYYVRGMTACGISKASSPVEVLPCIYMYGDENIVEGNDSVKVIVYLTHSYDEAVNFRVQTTDISSQSGSDYIGINKLFTFEPGKTIDSLYVYIRDDNWEEDNIESFNIALTNVRNAIPRNVSYQVKIEDNDPKPVVKLVEDVYTSENSDSAVFILKLDRPSSHTTKVNYITSDSTALAGTDYVSTSGQSVFSAGITTQHIKVPIIDNLLPDSTRKFGLTLSAPFNGTLHPNDYRKLGYILNDENAPPCISIYDATASEGDTLYLALEMNQSYHLDISVDFNFNWLTATAGDVDISSIASGVVFNAGDSVIFLKLPVIDDKIDENNEALIIELKSSNLSPFCRKTATLNLIDNDFTPVAKNDEFIVIEDYFINENLLANDTILGDTPVVITHTNPSFGTLNWVNNDGSFKYTPLENYYGRDNFTYTVTDSSGDSKTANVLLDVQPQNDIPHALDDVLVMNEDEVDSIDVALNDLDYDKKGLSILSYTNPIAGSVAVNGTKLIYTPSPNYFGLDSITYIIKDTEEDLDSATLYITINPVDEAPVAIDDEGMTNEDSSDTIFVLSNDYNPDNDAIRVDRIIESNNGTCTIWGTAIIFTPEKDFNGITTFTYAIKDIQDDEATATVTVTVTPVNDAPIAFNDTIDLTEDISKELLFLANDYDAENDIADYEILSYPSLGTISEGTSTINYSPNPNINGQDTIKYRICDSENLSSDTAHIFITIIAVNEAPIANDDNASTLEDQWVLISPLGNDSDPDNSGISISDYSEPMNGQVEIINATTLKYTPNTNFDGTDNFSYTIQDGEMDEASANIDITVTNINKTPLAVIDNINTPEDEPIEINPLENDIDYDGHGMSLVEISTPVFGSASQSGDNKISYEPKKDFYGKDSLSYTVIDDNGDEALGWIIISVSAVNDLPSTLDDAITLLEDSPAKSINPLENDEDVEKDSLWIRSLISNANIVANIENYNTISISPLANYYGSSIISYYISDNGADSVLGIINIVVKGINDEPNALDDLLFTDEDVSIDFNPTLNDTDIDGIISSIEIVDLPKLGTISKQGTTLKYVPLENQFGKDSLSYVVYDDSSAVSLKTWIRISINEINDLPVAVNDTLSLYEDSSIVFSPLFNDWDVEHDNLVFEVIEPCLFGEVYIENDTNIIYVPDPNFFGSDSLKYTLIDERGGTASAWALFVVRGLNDSPVALNDTIETLEDKPLQINTSLNDYDIDGNIAQLEILGTPQLGTLNKNALSISYEPKANVHGYDTIRYVVYDDSLNVSDTAYIFIRILSVNDDPKANTDYVITNNESSKLVNVLVNDLDPDMSGLQLLSIIQGDTGTASIVGDSSILYTPPTDYTGTIEIAYTIIDGEGDEASSKLIVNVGGVNHLPEAKNDSIFGSEDTALIFAVLENDIDNEKAGLKIDSISPPLFGTAEIMLDSILYSPAANWFGTDSIRYYISDIDGDIDSAQLLIHISSVNDAPLAMVDSFVLMDTVQFFSFNLLENDSDIEQDSLYITEVRNYPEHFMRFDGSLLSLFAAPDTLGLLSLSYTVSDTNGATSPGSIIIEIKHINQPPLTESFSVITYLNKPISINLLNNISDPEGNINLSSTRLTILPKNGNAEPLNGTITYTPNPNFVGNDSLLYKVFDAEGLESNTSMIRITVIESNNEPVAQNDTLTGNEDNTLWLLPLKNDFDEDDDLLYISEIIVDPKNGEATVIDDTVYYTPRLNFWGSDSITYVISDGKNAFASAKIYIHINAINDLPNFTGEPIIVLNGDSTRIQINNLSINDAENDSTIVSYTWFVNGIEIEGEKNAYLDLESTDNNSWYCIIKLYEFSNPNKLVDSLITKTFRLSTETTDNIPPEFIVQTLSMVSESQQSIQLSINEPGTMTYKLFKGVGEDTLWLSTMHSDRLDSAAIWSNFIESDEPNSVFTLEYFATDTSGNQTNKFTQTLYFNVVYPFYFSTGYPKIDTINFDSIVVSIATTEPCLVYYSLFSEKIESQQAILDQQTGFINDTIRTFLADKAVTFTVHKSWLYNMHFISATGLNTKGLQMAESKHLQLVLDDGFLFELYPVPFTSQLTVKTNSAGTLKLYDTKGVLVKTAKTTPGYNFVNTSHIADGLYIIRYSDGTHSIIRAVTKNRAK